MNTKLPFKSNYCCKMNHAINCNLLPFFFSSALFSVGTLMLTS